MKNGNGKPKPKLLGYPVYDATKPMSLDIVYRDTLQGRKDPWNCAAAKCLLRKPGVIEARVFRSITMVLYRKPGTDQKYWIRYKTPIALRSELIAFDRGGKFDPGAYTLVPPSPSQKLGAWHNQSRSRPHDVNTKKRAAPHVTKHVRQRAGHYQGKGVLA